MQPFQFEIPEPVGQGLFAIIAIGLSALAVAVLLSLVIGVLAAIVAFIGPPDDIFDIEFSEYTAVKRENDTSDKNHKRKYLR
jgi:hypothetical protein